MSLEAIRRETILVSLPSLFPCSDPAQWWAPQQVFVAIYFSALRCEDALSDLPERKENERERDGLRRFQAYCYQSMARLSHGAFVFPERGRN